MKNFYLDPPTYVVRHFSIFRFFSFQILVIHFKTIGEGAGSCPSIARCSKGARQCPSRRRKAGRETGRRVASGQCRCRQILCRPNRRCQQNHRNNNNSQTTDDNCCRSCRSCRSISNPQTLCHRQQVGQRSSPDQSGGRRLGQNFTNQINDVDFILVVVGRQEPIIDGRRRPSQDGGAGQKRGAAGRQEDERR
jgi:hypothetical protein